MALYSYTGKKQRKDSTAPACSDRKRKKGHASTASIFFGPGLAVHKFFHGEIAFFPRGNIITNHSH
jgi:hypothetical protein